MSAFFTKKIYINNKPLILTNIAEQYIDENPLAAGYLFLTGAFPRNLNMAIKHLTSRLSLGVVIEDISIEALMEMLQNNFQIINAGGGVVCNEDGDILMIYRRGKWDLPKGKQDEGETTKDCAQREVQEETGLEVLQVKNPICISSHVYLQGGKQILKYTYWYEMFASKNSDLLPQKEENILDVKWIPESKLNLYMHQTYDAIKEVLKQSGKL